MDNTIDIPHEVLLNGNGHKPEVDNTPDLIVLKFADAAIPVFKEIRSKDYIQYGEDNKYPQYLTYLFNKSGKHNAILTGKADYIFGEGFENGDMTVNRLGESLNDISKKAILDVEIYGGFRLEIIYNRLGKVSEIYHVDYTTIRVGKDNGYYYCETWEKYSQSDIEFIPAFDPGHPMGSQIYAYNEYRPQTRFYPLPSYIGCNNYVETDIEISKYYLSAIRNGMMPSKMIQFYQGEPTEDKKKEIERRFQKKFAGAENAGKFILVFGNDKQKQVDVSDLSASELDKQFVELNKTCQQEIYAGHKVTSPMLFGIKTEGQLGGNTELKAAYELFRNTYAKPKATAYAKEIQYLMESSIWPGQYQLKPTDPIGLQFDVKDVVNSIPKSFIFKSLGIPESEWENPAIAPPAGPFTPGPAGTPTGTAASNDNIKNLTAKQHQQLMRIIRQYSKGQLTEAAAKALLRTGLGLNEDDINNLLGIEPVPVAMSFELQEDILAMFDACGDSKNDYEILKSKRVSFSSEAEAAADELIYITEAFKTLDVTNTEAKILDMIRKDSRITADVISEALGETKAFIESKIASLTKRGYLETTIDKIGADEIIERIVPKGIDAPPPTVKSEPVQIFVKYSYEGPRDSKNRPFCAKMLSLNRLYSRAEIEKISERLGYSVFDRRGGFWTQPDGSVLPHCRHNWKSNVIVKKKEGSK